MKTVVLSAALIVGFANAAPAQDPVWDGNTVVLESQEPTDGMFVILSTGAEEMADSGYPVARSGGFVIGEYGGVVVDSLLNALLNARLNARLNAQDVDRIAAETELPVLSLTNTSFDGDHADANQYVPNDVVIIQHANAAAYLSEHLEADKAFMIQNFGESRGIEEIVGPLADLLVGQRGSHSVDLGGVQVAIRDLFQQALLHKSAVGIHCVNPA